MHPWSLCPRQMCPRQMCPKTMCSREMCPRHLSYDVSLADVSLADVTSDVFLTTQSTVKKMKRGRQTDGLTQRGGLVLFCGLSNLPLHVSQGF